MYSGLEGNLSGYPLIGNPDLDAEKAIYYELGLSQMLNDDLRINLTTYYRDIQNMVGAREIVDQKGNIFTVFTNSDYGSVKGVDFAIESTRCGNFNWSVNYSYMIARGNASDPYDWYYDYYTIENDDRPPIPTREYPLSYDQTHSLAAVADFRVGRNEKTQIMGWSVPDAWGINMLARFGSGLAYTRTDKNGRRIGALNAEQMPYILRFDMRFNKDFYFTRSNRTFLSFFVEVENLFDRRNVVNVYTSTGEPNDDGFVAQNVNSATYQQEVEWTRLMANDPQNYDHPRQVRVGLVFNF
jgi:outer membrane receptor protein involved in Fe transport